VAERLAQQLNKMGIPAKARKEQRKVPDDQEATLPHIFVRVKQDKVQVSIDAGAKRHWDRGWLKAFSPAPLRETIAAALVRVALHGGGDVPCIWDPTTGGGTIALEAADYLGGIARTDARSYALERWPTVDTAMFQEWSSGHTVEPQGPWKAASNTSAPRILGSDANLQAIRAARHNLQALRLLQKDAAFSESEVVFRVGAMRRVEQFVPKGSLLIANLPFGLRVSADATLAELHNVLTRRRDLQAVVLCHKSKVPANGPHFWWKTEAKFELSGHEVLIRRLIRKPAGDKIGTTSADTATSETTAATTSEA